MKLNPTARAGRRLAASVALAGAFLLPLAAFASPATSAVARTASRAAVLRSAIPRGIVFSAAHGREGAWKLLPGAPVHAFPDNVVSVWTGHEMIIHGSVNNRGVTFTYRPATSSWKKLADGPAVPNLQTADVVAWTGSRMLVLGLTNGAFNPVTDTWHPTAPDPNPQGQGQAVVGWTGRQMLVWGGTWGAGVSNQGVSYTPATNKWQYLPAAPIPPRRAAMGAWIGKQLVVAGGVTGEGSAGNPIKAVRSAAAYDPATRTWRKLAPMPAGPTAGGTAVWDGKEVLFLGVGGDYTSPSARGVAYNPVTNRWRRLPNMPLACAGFVAVWTGRQMLVWGGLASSGAPAPHGQTYNPATNRWTALPASPLRGRAAPAAVWTARQMIVWGGYNYTNGKTYPDGAAYTPGTP